MKNQSRSLQDFLDLINEDLAREEGYLIEAARREDIAARLTAGGEAGFETE